MRDLISSDESFREWMEPDERVLWQSRPGARGLFLSVLPRMLRDLVFLALVVAALLLAPRSETTPWNLAIVLALGVFLLWSLYREWREATAAKVSNYLITDRRLLLVLPRSETKICSITRGREKSRYDSSGRPQLSIFGPATCGTIRNGRANLIVPVRGYMAVAYHNSAGVERDRTITLKLIAVADPEGALAALRPSTRA